MARIVSCPYCGRAHRKDYDCGKRPVYKRGTEQDKYRNTYAWQRKRSEIMQRDNYVCRYCMTQGRIVIDRLSVHHIEPLEQRYDLRDNDGNLITLCDDCHKRAETGTIERSALHSLTISPPTSA